MDGPWVGAKAAVSSKAVPGLQVHSPGPSSQGPSPPSAAAARRVTFNSMLMGRSIAKVNPILLRPKGEHAKASLVEGQGQSSSVPHYLADEHKRTMSQKRNKPSESMLTSRI